MIRTSRYLLTIFGRRMGQTMALVLVAMPVMVGAGGLAIDVASYYSNAYRLQTAVDSAVLSGAWYLPDQPSKAKSTATTIATGNGIGGNDAITGPSTPTANTISMTVKRSVPFYFARVVGVNNGTVIVTATAKGGPAGLVNGTLPVGLQFNFPAYTDGQAFSFHLGAATANGNWANGNWDTLALGGTGAQVLQNNITSGYSGAVNIGDTISSEPGKKVGPVQQAFNSRISAGQSSDPSGTYSSYTANDQRAVTVLLVDWSNCGGRCNLVVKGFATIWIDSVTGGATINGHFISKGVSGAPSGGAPNEGALAISLIN